MTTSQMQEFPLTSEKMTTNTELNENEKKEKEGRERQIISFNIFSHFNNIYRIHGLMDEEFSRFLSYLKKRRKKIKSKYLQKTKKIEKRIMKIYPDEIVNKKHLELLLLDVEYCRCKYLKIKTDVNNLTIPRRGKYNYLNRLKKSLKRIIFLNRVIMQKEVDENTELQIKSFITFIECSYLLETNKYTECIEKIQRFIKLTKLVKRTLVNAQIESKALQEKEKEKEKETGIEEGGWRSNHAKEMKTLNESEQFLDVEEERKIGELFEYYLSMVDGYNRICLYNLKKIGKSKSREKLEEDDFTKEVKDHITEEPINNMKNTLEIYIQDTETVVSIKDCKYTLPEPDMNIVKIKNIVEEMKPVISTEEIEKLDIPSDLKNLNANYEVISKFLSKFEIDYILHDYGKLFVKCFDCLSIIHKELINSTNKKSKTCEDDKVSEKIWNKLELHFLTEKFYLDIERVLLILLKSLVNIYREKTGTGTGSERVIVEKHKKKPKKGEAKEKRKQDEKNNATSFLFKKKHTLHELMDTFPLLNEGIRYADILKQNVDGLQNIESNDLMINMFQIIKNVKSLCTAFYYVLANRNAEAHVLFDQVKTRNYIYLKLKKGQVNIPLLRIAILFNRLQDVLYMVNEKYYFRHLSFYSLMLKKKVPPVNSLLYCADNTLFTPHMYQVGLNPAYVDMTCKYNIENFLSSTLQKEREPGIRGLIKSFWKK